MDEKAVTLRLDALRWHHRVVPEALRWAGAAATVAAVAGGLMFFSGRSQAAEATPPAPRTEQVTQVGFTEPGLHTILASAGSYSGSSRLFELDELDEIIILEDEDEDQIVILDDPPVVAKKSRAQQRAEARRVARTHLNWGAALRAGGDAADAERHFKAALTALPSYSPAAAALAELHIKRRDHQLALKYAKQASDRHPANGDYLLLLGDTYLLTKRPIAARKAWRKARRLRARKAKSAIKRT